MPGGRAQKKEQCHGQTGRKKLGGRKKFARLFWIVPELSKKFSADTFQNENGNDYEKFLLDSIFPTKLTEFPTKWTEFKPILPDCEANIARLTLFAKQTGGGGLPPPPPPGTPMNNAPPLG